MSDLILSSDDRLPLYQRLKDALQGQIASGVWRPGDLIPAEEALARQCGAAIGTMRKAIEGLVMDGVLERRQGRGTLVRRADFSNSLFRFFRHSDALGRPLRPQGIVLRCNAGAASAEVAANLKIAEGSPVIELFRLRVIETQPIVVEEISLCARRFAGFAALAPDDFPDLLYPFYEREADAVVARATEHIRFGAARAPIAKALGVKTGSPVVVIARVARGYDGRPIEFRLSYGPAERFSYQIEIK